MRATDGHHADGAEEGGRRLVGQHLGHGAKHHVDDAADRLQVTTTGRGVLGRQHGARRNVEADRAKGATIHRHVRKDVLDGHIHRRQGGVARHVQRPDGARTGAGKVEVHLVTLDGDRHPHPQRCVDDAVVVHEIFIAVGAVGQLGDVGAHLALRVDDHLVQALGQHVAPVALDQGLDAPGADREHVGHGSQVAGNLVGQAHVGAKHRHQRGVEPASLVQLDRRDDDALLVHLGGARRPAAGGVAADVHPVAGGGHDREQFAFDKNRGDQLHVLQVAATEVWVVQDPHVAGFEATLGVRHLDQALHRELHVGQKHRQAITTLGYGFARGRVEYAVGAVVGFRNDRRYRRVDQVQIHLVGNLFEAAANNGKGYCVHHFTCARRLLRASTVTTMSGSITVVVSLCSTMAGPLNCMPGVSASRW